MQFRHQPTKIVQAIGWSREYDHGNVELWKILLEGKISIDGRYIRREGSSPGDGQNAGFRLFQNGNDLVTAHREEPLQKIVNSLSPLQVLNEGLNRNPCVRKDRSPTQYIRRQV